jgi:hypothetical protein
MKMDWAFLLVAVPMENSPRQKTAGKIEYLLPQSSDTGAQHNGPKANPRLSFLSAILLIRAKRSTTYIYNETDKTDTSELILT